MELFRVKTVIKTSCQTEHIVYVFADNDEQAKKEAEKNITKTGGELNKPRGLIELVEKAMNYERPKIKIEGAQYFPTCIIPIKGVKRSGLTTVQKHVLHCMLYGGGVKAQIRYVPSTDSPGPRLAGWRMLNAGNWTGTIVDIKTVIALRRKNLLIPMSVSSEERRVQQALGTFEVGEFRFSLNIKELQKRKLYNEYIKKQEQL